MTKGQHGLAGPMREKGTEMSELSMEERVMAAWKETEKEHKNCVAERIKRRHEKLNKAHSTNGKYLYQWIRQDCQTPIATMKRTDGSITLNFQEIHPPDTRRGVETDCRQGGMEERTHVTLTSRSVLDDSSRTS